MNDFGSFLLQRLRRSVRDGFSVAALLIITGCGSAPLPQAAEPEPVPVVFINAKSKALYVAKPGTDAVPDMVSKLKLSAARYCPECKQWYPVPPAEVMHRQPQSRLCPKTRTVLLVDGPLPETAKSLP